jgi:hypothetical protein
MKQGLPYNGIIFDQDKNYYNYSKLNHNKGYTYSESSGLGYIGDLKDGKPHGMGMLISEVGVLYAGHFLRGLSHGKGIIFKNTFEID